MLSNLKASVFYLRASICDNSNTRRSVGARAARVSEYFRKGQSVRCVVSPESATVRVAGHVSSARRLASNQSRSCLHGSRGQDSGIILLSFCVSLNSTVVKGRTL